jgi:hypothetical protein
LLTLGVVAVVVAIAEHWWASRRDISMELRN